MADDLYARSSALPRRFINLMSALQAGRALALVFNPLERVRAAYERAGASVRVHRRYLHAESVFRPRQRHISAKRS